MKRSDLLWLVDVWIVEFETRVDACFGSGDPDTGYKAYREWHARVTDGLAALDPALSTTFSRYGPVDQDLIHRHSHEMTVRARFMRYCGTPALTCLRRLRSFSQQSGEELAS